MANLISFINKYKKQIYIGDMVKVINPGSCRNTYKSWITFYGKQYLSFWTNGELPIKGEYYQVVIKKDNSIGPLVNGSIFLIKKGDACYIMDEEGIEKITF